MWAADRHPSRAHCVRTSKQRGDAAVEFALLVVLFLALVFGILEIERLIYLFNTLQEVTRRAAVLAVSSPFDKGAQETIQRQALFLGSDGKLIFGAPVTPEHVRIEYLSLARDAAGALTTPQVAALPASPANNRLNCVANPNGDNCIRFVRVRICQPNVADGCVPVPYEMLFPLINLTGLILPRSETIAPAQTLGYTAGSLPGS